MDRILRGLRIGSETHYSPDEEAHSTEEEHIMHTATHHYESLPNEDDAGVIVVEEPPVAAVIKRSDILKVSSRSRPSAVAGAIAGVVRESGRAEVQAIGAGAANQAIKAVAIARDYLAETGINAVCLPSFIDVVIDDEDRTALRMIVEPR